MDTTIIHDMIMLFVGMAISLMTTLILWLVPFIINRFKGLTIKIRVMEKNNNQITIKFYFKNIKLFSNFTCLIGKRHRKEG